MKSRSEPWRFSFSSRTFASLRTVDGCVLRHAVRQVAVHAARPVVGRVHARAGHRLVHVHQVLALAEGVEEDRHRAHVERVRADPHQVIQDARDLVEHHADVLRAHAARRRRAASRSPSRRRARCTSSTRSRGGPCTARVWMYVRVSASFSVARCSRPMCGSARWITSPSSSSTRRSTPCAAGCCGPKFIV